MNEQVDADGDRDAETTTPDMQVPDGETQSGRPSRRQVIVGGFMALTFVVALNGTRVWMRLTSDCDLPLWVYCIVCPRLSDVSAKADRSRTGPYTEVVLKSGFTGEIVYFNAAGRLVAAAEWSDTNDYCTGATYGRWFGQRFWAGLDEAADLRSQHKLFPTPQGADTWR